MAYGILDDEYLKKLAGTIRYRANLPDRHTFNFNSKDDKYIGNYICRIPTSMNINALGTLKLGVGGTSRGSFTVNFVTVSDDGSCQKQSETKSTDDYKGANDYIELSNNILPGSFISITPNGNAKFRADSSIFTLDSCDSCDSCDAFTPLINAQISAKQLTCYATQGTIGCVVIFE